VKTPLFYFGDYMAEEIGTKETKEALRAVIAIIEFIIERTKDGVGVDDAFAIWSKFSSDAVFKAKVKAGWENVEAVRNEISNLSTAGITALGFEIAPELIALLLKLKKE
jgi:hypothetical protein